ncbi:outer membrane protein assembly factor BamE [Glaciecola sp. 1036]|uniref:outer membrane protein assembly factor BamE n=1 Tax=Alteromonadaceae TaxID=72275 RepID=UPI003D078F98
MRFAAVLLLILLVTGCSNWIYRIDVPQGNYLDQKDVDKLRINMTKEQVQFVLGNPVVEDSFDQNTWYYVYDMKRGMEKRGKDVRLELVLEFVEGRLAKMNGDFDKPENFDEPLES